MNSIPLVQLAANNKSRSENSDEKKLFSFVYFIENTKKAFSTLKGSIFVYNS